MQHVLLSQTHPLLQIPAFSGQCFEKYLLVLSRASLLKWVLSDYGGILLPLTWTVISQKKVYTCLGRETSHQEKTRQSESTGWVRPGFSKIKAKTVGIWSRGYPPNRRLSAQEDRRVARHWGSNAGALSQDQGSRNQASSQAIEDLGSPAKSPPLLKSPEKNKKMTDFL